MKFSKFVLNFLIQQFFFYFLRNKNLQQLLRFSKGISTKNDLAFLKLHKQNKYNFLNLRKFFLNF